ncbi:MAG: hypothetical protein ACLSUW_07125 [Akkermansia sp.]
MEYAHYQDDAAAIREAYAAWLILSSPNRSREWPETRKNTMRAFGSWPPT